MTITEIVENNQTYIVQDAGNGKISKFKKVILPEPIILELVLDKTEVKADNTDTITINATLTKNKMQIDYNKKVYANIKNYGAIAVQFANGKTTIELKVPPEKSGKIEFTNDDTTLFTLKEPVTVWAIMN